MSTGGGHEAYVSSAGAVSPERTDDAVTTTAETIRRMPRPRRAFRARQEARNGWLFMAPFAILFIMVFLVPIIISVRSAFFAQIPGGDGLFGGGELVDTF